MPFPKHNVWLPLALAALWLFAVPQEPTGALDLDGKAMDPLKSASGRVTVLLFVRTDCPISNRYAPTIGVLGTKYRGRVNFWLVYPDRRETPEAIRKHIGEFAFHAAALRDPAHALVRLSRARITPEAAVFDAQGALVYHGRIDDWFVEFGRARPAPTTHELDDAIQSALRGAAARLPAVDAVGCYISDLE